MQDEEGRDIAFPGAFDTIRALSEREANDNVDVTAITFP